MITILGATGNVGGKIADIMISKGKPVRLVARSVEKLRQRVGKRSAAMAGDAMDTEFLVKAFQGSAAVFTLIPPYPHAADFLDYAGRIGESIARALEIARIDYCVNLSSIGAELPSGTGPIQALHDQEERLNRVPGLNVIHLRAAFFMENLLTGISMIRDNGIQGSGLRGDLKIPMIATEDIASFAADRLILRDFKGSSVRYLLGRQDLSMNEATMTIGIKIGKPNLRYVMFSYEDLGREMVRSGLSQDMTKLYLEMNMAFNEGRITAKRAADNTTPTGFDRFCEDTFVPLFMQKRAA